MFVCFVLFWWEKINFLYNLFNENFINLIKSRKGENEQVNKQEV